MSDQQFLEELAEVIDALGDDDWQKRTDAARLIGLIPISQVHEALRAAVADSRAPSGIDRAVSAAAIRSIFATADPVALRVLLLEDRAATDRDDVQMGSIISAEFAAAVHGSHPDEAARLLGHLRTIADGDDDAASPARDLLEWLSAE